jgi:hypothetical protein
MPELMKTPNFKIFTRIVLSAALAFAPCGFATTAHSAEADKSVAVVPFETLGIGNESGCTKRALFVINDETEWQRVWGVHRQGIPDAQPLPKIDFSRQSVIAVLSGERADGKSLQIAQVVRSANETVAYFMISDEKSWLGVPEAEAKTDANKKAQPYIFAAVDKITTPLRFADVFGANSSCNKCAG